MFVAYRFARKKYQQRQAAKASFAAAGNNKEQTTSLPTDTTPQAQPAQDEHTNNNNVADTPKAKCVQCKEEKSAARKYRWKLLFCLLPAFFDASLDLTIVATALPQIASHFGQSTILVCLTIH